MSQLTLAPTPSQNPMFGISLLMPAFEKAYEHIHLTGELSLMKRME
jgi:hypothetical protein